MKAVDHQEFRTVSSPRHGIRARVGSLAAWLMSRAKLLASPRFDPTLLTPRLRRDAGMDETEVERYRLENGPLIR